MAVHSLTSTSSLHLAFCEYVPPHRRYCLPASDPANSLQGQAALGLEPRSVSGQEPLSSISELQPSDKQEITIIQLLTKACTDFHHTVSRNVSKEII